MSSPPHQTYRPRKKVLYQGMGYSFGFLAAILLHTSFPFIANANDQVFQWDGSAPLFIGMGIAVYGPMLLLSLAVWWTYFVERLTQAPTEVQVRSLWGTRVFDLAKIESLRWRTVERDGSLHVRGPGGKMRLNLQNYAPADCLQIVYFFRQAIPFDRQEGWPQFCHQVAVPLRDGIPASEVGLTPPERAHSARWRQNIRYVVWGLFVPPLQISLMRWLGAEPLLILTVGVTILLGLLLVIVAQPKPTRLAAAEQERIALQQWEQGTSPA